MRFKLIASIVTTASLLGPITSADAVSNSTGGNDSYSPSNGGGAVGLPFNDLWGIENSKLRFFLTGPEGHRNLTRNCSHSYNSKINKVAISGAVCTYPTASWTGDDFQYRRLTNVVAPRDYWAGIFKSGYRRSAHIKNEIGVSTNLCGVGKAAKYFNGCENQSYNFSGTNYKSPAGSGNNAGWSQMHAASPNDLTPKNSLGAAVYGNGDQGRTVIGMLRIWRDCADGDIRWTKGGCIKQPIFSRTPPSSDHKYTREGYFKATWDGTKDISLNHSSLGELGNRYAANAGHLYGRCTPKKYCFSINKGGIIGGVRSPDAQGPFEKSCFSGSLGSGTVWTAAEFVQEAEYLHASGSIGDATYDTFVKWAGKSADHPIGWPARPAGWTVDNTKRFVCKYFSEWLAVDWKMSDFKGSSNDWKINMELNMIPSRVYVSQAVGIDPRENPTKETITTFTSSASSVCEISKCGGTPPPPYCGNVETYLANGNTSDNVVVPTDKDGKPDWSSEKILACHPAKSDRNFAPAIESPGLNSKLVKSQSAGQSTTPEYEGITAPMDQGTASADSAMPDATWLPRALQVAVFNPQNAASDKPIDAYKSNHSLASSRRADSTIATRFTLGGIAPLADSLTSIDGSQTSSTSSQGSSSATWAKLVGSTQVTKPGGVGNQSMASADWWKTLLPLHPFVTDTGSDGNNYGDPGIGNSLKFTVNNTTSMQPDADRKALIAAQSSLTALQDKTNKGGLTPEEDIQQKAAQEVVDKLETQRDLKYNETRLFSMIGESRYAAKWDITKNCDSRQKSNPKDWCSKDAPELRHERLTLDKCIADQSPDLLVAPGQKPEPQDGTTQDIKMVPDYNKARACTSESGNLAVGDGLKVSDAYKVPPIVSGAPEVELAANFHQEQADASTLSPAFLSFDANTTDPAKSITPNIARIEIWNLDDYKKRTMQSNPSADATGTADPTGAADAATADNPCTDSDPSTECIAVTDDNDPSIPADTAPPSEDPAGQVPADPPPEPNNGGNNEAPLYAATGSNLTLGNGPGKPSSHPYIELCGIVQPSGTCSQSASSKWQPQWLPNARAVDPAKYADISKRASGDIFPAGAATEPALAGGDYMIVVVLSNPKPELGPGADSPEVARWGIDAYLNDYANRIWASWFTVANSQSSVAVYQSRAIG